MQIQFFIGKYFLEVEGIWREVEINVFVINGNASHDLKKNERMWEKVKMRKYISNTRDWYTTIDFSRIR